MRRTTTKKKIRQSPKLPAATRREQLLKAARMQFIKKGYRATTTEDIARQAGLTKGALYFHFKSKEDIFRELVTQATDKFVATFEQQSKGKLSPGEVLKLLRQIDVSRDMPHTRHSLNLRAEAMKLPRIKMHVNRAIRKIIHAVAERLDPVYGRDKRSRQQLAILIFAVYDGLVLGNQMIPQLINFDNQIRMFTELLEPPRKAKKRTGKKR